MSKTWKPHETLSTLLSRGEFERGILPDEVNWKEGKSDPTFTRQICNAWKANAAIARIVLRLSDRPSPP